MDTTLGRKPLDHSPSRVIQTQKIAVNPGDGIWKRIWSLTTDAGNFMLAKQL
jgi:hypothetical protein